MPRTNTAEPPALETYYAAISDAKELVQQKLVGAGMDKWEHALKNVAQSISVEELSVLKQEFDDFFSSWRREKARGHDTDSDSSGIDGVENSDNEDGNDSADIGHYYQLEYSKLARMPTMRSSRSSTFPVLRRRGTAQMPRTNVRNNTGRFDTPLDATESTMESLAETRTKKPTTRNESMAVSRPTTNPATDESGFNKSSEDRGQATRSGAQPHSVELMGRKENNEWFGNLKSIAHSFVYGEEKQFWPGQQQTVKVAILDSGFALTGEARKAMKPYSSRIQDKKSFTHEFPDPKTPLEKQRAWDDPVGHGTTVAYQLMETCPSAHVYIAKVTVGESAQKTPVPDKGAVARAIRYAATPASEGGWGVDIINMSFGWNESELPGTDGVSSAIEFAEKKGVLLFAAASNYGVSRLNDVLYPARDQRVISVDAEDGLGNPAPFALRSLSGDGGVRYCAPGLSVDTPVSAVPVCGSSFACPVAAGVAALVLEFARHESVSLSKSKSVRTALSSFRGMRKVFGRMSQQADNRPGFKMLYPWHFLGDREREDVARDIVEQLKIEFGEGNVGFEVRWTTTWQTVRATTGA
ncbi:peptidase S8/S53 domain-containing protein [Nemania abortiva]|nr:peptidase S8/S53 domain-containing protein [Nemania abortiva]